VPAPFLSSGGLMFRLFSVIRLWFLRFVNACRLALLFRLQLRPRILQLRKYVLSIVHVFSERFPEGKSVFIFPGEGDTMYFIIQKSDGEFSVPEIYDELFNHLPESYRVLQQVFFRELVPENTGRT